MASRKGKRRNSEKRKEKSRDAARYRRNKESEVFSDLASMLPLPMSQTLQQDKASIMRLAISHLKLRKLLGKDITEGDYKDTIHKKLDMQYPKALEGFVIILAHEGDMIYLSENVSKYLGLTQLDLIGHSVYDFTHPCDHDEIREMLSEKATTSTADNSGNERSFLMRMKCTITSKGRNINLKSATYKVVRCSGRYVSAGSGSRHLLGLLDNQDLSCLLLIGEPIPHPANIEVPLDTRTFVSKHNLNMKFIYCDDRINQLLGYSSEGVISHSVFDFHHALDSEVIKDACKGLFSKGQAVVGKYRFLASGGGYCWVQTEATIITHQRTEKAQCVVCVNYVLSEVLEKDLVLSHVQIMKNDDDCSKALAPKCTNVPALAPRPVPSSMPYSMPCSEDTLPSGIILSTESIFAPRPSDADADMLCVTDVDGKVNMLDDLAQLAPSAGNVMTPLNFMNDGREELYKDVEMMSNVYNNTEELLPADTSVTNNNATPNTDEIMMMDLRFLTCDGSAAAATYALNEKLQSKPANNSRSNIKAEDETITQESKNQMRTELGEDFDEVDFDLRAPYIPMDGLEDKVLDCNWVPLLDEELENSQMLGTTESVFAPKPPEPEGPVNHKVPLSILRLQAANKMLGASVGNIARHAGPPKIKRPMETNRLETGPPQAKSCKMSVEQLQNTSDPRSHQAPISVPLVGGKLLGKQAPNPGPSTIRPTSYVKDQKAIAGSSVLKNLLTQGKDVNYGYQITNTRPLAKAMYPEGEGSSLRALLLGDYSDDEYLETDSYTSEDDVMVVSSPEPPTVPTPPLARRILPKPAPIKEQPIHSHKKLVEGSAMLFTLVPASYQNASAQPTGTIFM